MRVQRENLRHLEFSLSPSAIKQNPEAIKIDFQIPKNKTYCINKFQ